MIKQYLRNLRSVFRRGHHWQYRNPYDRACSICGRHEVEYTLPCYPRNPLTRSGWWEAHSDGDPALHAPAPEE